MYNHQLSRHTQYTIGVDSTSLNTVYASQQNPMACWAASHSNFLRLKGLNVDQSVFINDHCGVNWLGLPKHCGASTDHISVLLNGCSRDNWGRQYCVTASQRTKQELNGYEIFNKLRAGKPFIIAYWEHGAEIGHVILLTGATILFDRYTGETGIQDFIIRDPANTDENKRLKGRYSVNAADFLTKVRAWWSPEVYHKSWNYWIAA
jgi:hypothetical protein